MIWPKGKDGSIELAHTWLSARPALLAIVGCRCDSGLGGGLRSCAVKLRCLQWRHSFGH